MEWGSQRLVLREADENIIREIWFFNLSNEMFK